MTRKEWNAINPTWKAQQLKAIVSMNAKPIPYDVFRRNLMINCQTMFIKRVLMRPRTV